MAAHGTCAGYTTGCRCDQCRAAHATYKRERRAMFVALGILPAGVTHGRAATYTNYRCRCELCLRAWADKVLELRHRRSARPVPDGLNHGAVTYANYRCRCDICRTAWAAAARRQRQRAKTKETL